MYSLYLATSDEGSSISSYQAKQAQKATDPGRNKRKHQIDVLYSDWSAQLWPTLMHRRRCRMCAKRGIRAEPGSGCEKCQANLCLKGFKPYHLLLKKC